jgi:glyoxylase-like metal-dependent hydrolase (beta-lactamase superfamily II)
MPQTFERDVVPGVHRIEDAYVNWFLLVDDTGLTAVDAGLPKSWESLQQVTRMIDRSPADVRAVVLTHAHYDHVGFAERARTELGAPVLVHPNDEPLSRHPLRFRSERLPLLYMWRPATMRIIAEMIAAGALQVPPVGAVTTYADGDVLDVPGHPRVVATPGHTDGHCSLHLPDVDAVIAGDALVTLDPYTARTGPRLVARAATADVGTALSSLDRLQATGATVVLPGHGAPWRDGVAEAVRLARAAGSD